MKRVRKSLMAIVLAGVVCLALFLGLLLIGTSSADTPAVEAPATQPEGKNKENEIASRAAVRMFEERDLMRIARTRPQTLKNLSPTQGNRVALAAAKSLKIEDYLMAIGIRDIHKDDIFKDIHKRFTKHPSQDSPAEAECRRQLGINVEAADWLGYLARERLIDDPGVLPYLIEAINHPDRVSVASRCLGALTLLTRHHNSGLPSTNPMQALENRKTRNEIVSWWKDWWEKSKDKHPIYDARVEGQARKEVLRLAKVIENRLKPRYPELSMFTAQGYYVRRWPPLFHVYHSPWELALGPLGVSRDKLPWFHISCTFKTPDLPADDELIRRRNRENLPPEHLRNMVRKVFSKQLEGTDIVIEVFAASKRDQLLDDLATTLDEKSSSQPATQPAKQDSAAVRWIDAKTGQVLFTLDDIVRFDWEKQLFELRRGRAIELMMLPPTLQRNFVVKDEQGDIYHGCFMSQASSMSYDGPTIPIGAIFPTDVKPPLYKIEAGYGGYRQGSSRDKNDKKRFHPRLRDALKAAGLLGNIDPASPPIATSFAGWYGGQNGLKIGAKLFAETFRIGKETRFQLCIAKDKTFNLRPDRLELSVTWLAKGKNFPMTERMEVPLDTLDKGMRVYAYRGWPWGSERGSVDPTVQPGRGEVTVQLQALRRSGDAWNVIGTWQIPTMEIAVLQPVTSEPTAQPRTQPAE